VTWTGAAYSPATGSFPSNLLIFAKDAEFGGNYAEITFDDVAFWTDRVLTPTEIADWFWQGQLPSDNTAFWRFDDIDGSTIIEEYNLYNATIIAGSPMQTASLAGDYVLIRSTSDVFDDANSLLSRLKGDTWTDDDTADMVFRINATPEPTT
jgi:hypothetical protein